jgi:type II secretory pathway component PulF
MTFPATKSSEVSDSSKNGRKSTSADHRQGKNVDRFGTFDEVEGGSSPQMSKDYNRTLQKTVIPASPELYRAKVKQSELILFTTQLSVMLDSGVVLSDALDAIAEQAEHGTFKMIIMNVAEKVKSGDNFSKALAGYSKVFNTMFISMVKASEASGRMAEMLNVLTGYLNFESETRKRIKGALTYPFIMALMAVAATGTLMFFVLPRFMGIYESRGAALPNSRKY